MDKTSKSKNAAPGMLIPQEEYLRGLYAVAQHWQSDVKFFENELNFFRLLISKHLVLLIDSKNIEQTRSMVSHLFDLEKERAIMDEQISRHTLHFADLVENPFVQDVQDYKREHAKLEDDFQLFVKKFRAVKSEVFKITERVIHSDKVKRMID